MNERKFQARDVNGLFKLTSISELSALPPPSWLIDKLIEQSVFAVLYGASGEGKSFLALDWALSIATGKPWQGRKVKRGPVVYVVAEGGRNIGKRIKAWMIERDADPHDFLMILDAVQFRKPEHVQHLLGLIEAKKINPELIVVDTLARCFLGGDEN